MKVKGNPEATSERVAKAIEVLEGNSPDPSPDCTFCSWFAHVKTQIESSRTSADIAQDAAEKVAAALRTPATKSAITHNLQKH